jgi:C1A family cysteine protease
MKALNAGVCSWTLLALILANPNAVQAGESNSDISLDHLKKEIQSKHKKWKAEQTSVSGLPLELKKKRANAKEGVELAEASAPSANTLTSTTATYPATLDWRNNNGNYVTPIKDQGSCGSCWVFGTTAAAESAVLISQHTPYDANPINISEQVVLSCSGGGDCNGGAFTTAAVYLSNYGAPTEACYPYTASNGSCSSACSSYQTSVYRPQYIIGSMSDGTNVDTVKRMVATYGPTAVKMYVYSDFYYYKGGIYSYTSGSYVGCHIVTIVGYDDATQSFIVKNSWGTGWGEQGFFRIAYSEMNSPVGFAINSIYAYNTSVPAIMPATTPDSQAPQIAISSPAANTTLSGKVAVSFSATDNVGITKVELYANNSLVGSSTTSPYSISLDTRLIPNGGASLIAYAYDAASNKGVSPAVNVMVSNIADTVAPSVVIQSPASGATVSGSVSISASATDNVGVAAMACYVDNVQVGSSLSGQASCNWNAKRAAAGTHVIRVDAKDAAGNVGSSSINVNVQASVRKK